MARFNYNRARKVVARQIKRFGPPFGDPSLLRRGNITRPCIAARLEFSPEQRELHEVGTSRILIAANSTDVAPHHDLDTIYLAGAEYRIVEPIKGFRQDSASTLYYDCTVSYTRAVSYLRPVELIGAISIGVGFDMDVERVEIVNEIKGASFAIGFDMYPVPLAQAINFIEGASFAFGFDMEAGASITVPINASFAFGFDMTAPIEGTKLIEGASFALGFDMQANATAQLVNYIEVAFDFGFDMSAPTIEDTQYISAAFSMGFDIAATVTAVASSSDDGDATATIDDTTPQAGQTITCTFNDDDPDGPATGITYQWQHSGGTNIAGATSAAYTVQQAMVGNTLRCRVNYTDGEGFPESIFTANTSAVTANNQAVSASGLSSLGTGTTGTSLATASFSLGANEAVIVFAACTGSTAGISSITNNKGLTVIPIDANSVGWSQTVAKQAVIYAAIIFNGGSAQTGMTCTVNMTGTIQRSMIEAYSISGGHVVAWRNSSNPGGIIRQTKTYSVNSAGLSSWGVSTTTSESTSSRWIWMGQAVAVGEAGENDDFTSATLGGNAAGVLRDFTSASPGHQILCATRLAAATSAETMAISATGGNSFRELNGLALEFRGTPP